MNYQQACDILGITPGTSEADAKKRYRLLASELHPDKNKEEGAEDRFKEINQAYDIFCRGEQSHGGWQQQDDVFGGFPFPFGGFQGGGRITPAEPIRISLKISFKESVLGCRRDVGYSRKTKCTSCEGQGSQKQNNGCPACGGKGVIMGRQGNTFFSQTCSQCRGKTSSSACSTCNSSGALEGHASVSVSIPGGVVSGNILRLVGMGHFMGTMMGMEQCSDVLISLEVEPTPGLSLQGNDVLFTLPLPLVQAVSGATLSVPTIHGERDVIIPPLSRHQEEVIIPEMGVLPHGVQRVKLDVSYPDNLLTLLSSPLQGETKDNLCLSP